MLGSPNLKMSCHPGGDWNPVWGGGGRSKALDFTRFTRWFQRFFPACSPPLKKSEGFDTIYLHILDVAYCILSG